MPDLATLYQKAKTGDIKSLYNYCRYRLNHLSVTIEPIRPFRQDLHHERQIHTHTSVRRNIRLSGPRDYEGEAVAGAF